MKIAVIGTGISGLGAAYLLNPLHDVTVFEKNATPGGHSRTITIAVGRKQIPVDTGFIVFNHRNYPELTGLFRHLQVATEKSDMSFGASIGNGAIEYGSKGLFAQRRNLLRPKFWRMVFDILRFNRRAKAYLNDQRAISLNDLLIEMKMGDWFCKYYLQAMGAAIWSCSVQTILTFPARTFLRFFNNHGLLSVRDHPQWYTVTGGSREYVARITGALKNPVRLNCRVRSVTRVEDGIIVETLTGETEKFDQVVMACHADEALAMMTNPSAVERDVLSRFTYQHNEMVAHADASFMPKRRKCWASWVYLSETPDDQAPSVSLTYWMNNLQNLKIDTPVLVTLNPGRQPDAATVFDRHTFKHPVFNQSAIEAQADIPKIQGVDRLWFCGAYQKYGFHEDGLASAVRVADAMGMRIPWH